MESVETIYCYYLYDVHEWVLKLNVIASGDLDRVNDYIKATERDLCWHVYHPFFKYHISALSLEDMINLSRENKIAYLKELCNRIHDRSLNFLLDRHGYFYNLAAETYCKTDTIDDFKRLGELDTEKEAISVLGRKFTPNKQD